MKPLEVRNLFFTRTALGVYATLLGTIAVAAAGLAHQYDEVGRLKVTDWVLAGCGILTAISGQGVVLGARVASNGSLTYTPRGVWGPNREDVVSQVEQLSTPSPVLTTGKMNVSGFSPGLTTEEIEEIFSSSLATERAPEVTTSHPDQYRGE
jgi:hypothetical protein